MNENQGKGLIEKKLREELRKHGRAHLTEKSYVGWYLRFVRFHNKRHPATMGVPQVEEFLTYLAMERVGEFGTSPRI